jgi:hypothetical protein
MSGRKQSTKVAQTNASAQAVENAMQVQNKANEIMNKLAVQTQAAPAKAVAKAPSKKAETKAVEVAAPVAVVAQPVVETKSAPAKAAKAPSKKSTTVPVASAPVQVVAPAPVQVVAPAPVQVVAPAPVQVVAPAKASKKAPSTKSTATAQEVAPVATPATVQAAKAPAKPRAKKAVATQEVAPVAAPVEVASTVSEPKFRSLTGYMLFVNENRVGVIKSNPALKFTEIGSELGKLWNALSAEQKADWNTRAKAVKVEVKPKKEKRVKAQVAGPTQDKLDQLLANKEKLTSRSHLSAIHRRVKELDRLSKGKVSDTESVTIEAHKAALSAKAEEIKTMFQQKRDGTFVKEPARPKNAYMFYLDEHREQIKTTLAAKGEKHDITDVTKYASTLWKAMTEEQKQPFNAKAAASKAEFAAKKVVA